MKQKRIYMIWIALSGCLAGFAQEARVEKSVWGVQGGLLSVWGYNESRLADDVALRSEVGLLGSFSYTYSNFSGGSGRYTLIPELTVEPRWYYNLARRRAKSKFTMHNSGDYFSLRTSFYPEWPVISNPFARPLNALDIVPVWGIRRHYGTHFSLETSAGIGYRHVFGENSKDAPVFNWRFCIGYTF
ncbi:MAG: hypothetical protein LBL07_03105 [Tannerella sp.]|jgi:hypothetical protein|nr:hypothetical protein [Tannerella sp.]